MRLPSSVLTLLAVLLAAPDAFAGGAARFTLPSGVSVEIVEAPFDASVFEIKGCSEKAPACLINGQVPFGTAYGLPKTYVKSITATFNGKSHSLDVSSMYDAWGARPLEHPGAVRYFGGKCFDSRNCQFRGLFSDAAGSFVAEWRVVNGTSVRTVLTSSDDVVSLFLKHIDPPEYD